MKYALVLDYGQINTHRSKLLHPWSDIYIYIHVHSFTWMKALHKTYFQWIIKEKKTYEGIFLGWGHNVIWHIWYVVFISRLFIIITPRCCTFSYFVTPKWVIGEVGGNPISRAKLYVPFSKCFEYWTFSAWVWWWPNFHNLLEPKTVASLSRVVLPSTKRLVPYIHRGFSIFPNMVCTRDWLAVLSYINIAIDTSKVQGSVPTFQLPTCVGVWEVKKQNIKKWT